MVYVLTEMQASVAVMSYDDDEGRLTDLETVSALPETFTGNRSGAEIAAHPNGKVVYTSNRGQNTIAIFDVAQGGRLKLRGAAPSGGRTPRHFALAPGAGYLFAANQDSNNVVVFRVDAGSGELIPPGVVLDVPSPVCVVFAG